MKQQHRIHHAMTQRDGIDSDLYGENAMNRIKHRAPCARQLCDKGNLPRKPKPWRPQVAVLSIAGGVLFLTSPFVMAWQDQFYTSNPPGPVIHDWVDPRTNESHEENLGGELYPSVGRIVNCLGEWELFARGADNALWTKWQLPDLTSWSEEWASMGGFFKGTIELDKYWTGHENGNTNGPCGVQVTIHDGQNYASKRRDNPWGAAWSEEWEQH
jgi:hypothetical protein